MYLQCRPVPPTELLFHRERIHGLHSTAVIYFRIPFLDVFIVFRLLGLLVMFCTSSQISYVWFVQCRHIYAQTALRMSQVGTPSDWFSLSVIRLTLLFVSFWLDATASRI